MTLTRVLVMAYNIIRVVVCGSVLIAACTACSRQAGATIDGPPECSRCRIQLVEVARLSATDAAGQALFPSTLMQHESGAYLLGPTLVPGTVAVFSSDGAFRKTIGRHGRGPGEMREVLSVGRWRGDSVAIIHDSNKASIFNSNFEYGRTVTFESSSFLLREIASTELERVLAARNGTAGGEDYPLREFSYVGQPERGFGAATLFGQGEDRMYSGVLAAGDTTWAANRTTYEIDVFSRGTGARVATVARRLTWFPPNAEPNAWGGTPAIVDLGRPSRGKLWVLMSRPRREFTLPVAPPRRDFEAAAPVQPGVGDVGERYEYIIELLDLDRHAALAAATLSHRVAAGFLHGDHLYGYDEDSTTGSLTVVVWRLNVVE